MSEREPSITPESYVTDKSKAEFMAEAESSAQEALSRKLNGEDIITKFPDPVFGEQEKNWSEDELRKNINDRSETAAIRYDYEKRQSEAEVNSRAEENPNAVVDPSEAMVMANATKAREEEIAKLKQEAYAIIEKGQVVPETVIDMISNKRKDADLAAERASEIYKI